MKNYKKWVVLLILAVCSSGMAMAEKPKIATVDIQKLFKEYHRTIVAQKRFNIEYAKIQKAIGEKEEAVKKMRQKIQLIADELKKDGLSSEQKAEKQQAGMLIAQEMKFVERDVKKFSQSEHAKLAEKKALNLKWNMADIQKKVESISEGMGYDYVFDKSGLNTNQVTFFLYLKDAPDITTAVLKELNKFAPGVDSE